MGFGDIVNGVPVFGHAKAAYHFISGDRYQAGKALKAATRTTAVMAGGAAGAIVGGPAGMYAGAVGAGTCYDGVSSVVNNKAEGVFDGLKDVAKDLGNGNYLPVKSVLKTGLYLGADAISGATGGSIAGNMPAVMGKSLVKDAAVVVVKSTTTATCSAAVGGNVTRKIAKNIEYKNSTYSNFSSSISHGSASGGGGGQQPSQNNRNNTEQSTTETHFQLLCRLFNVTKLADIEIAGVFIFREITSGLPTDKARENALKNLIQALRDDGIVERVIESVRNIFQLLDRSEVTFHNFMDLCEMEAVYAGVAIGAGTCYDDVSSMVNNKAEGEFDGLKDVANDVENENNLPVKSVIKTGLYAGADSISGATSSGGSIAGSLLAVMGKFLVKDATVVVVKSTTTATCSAAVGGNFSRKIAKNIEYKNFTFGNFSSSISPGSASGEGGGQQPPQNNRNNTQTEHEQSPGSASGGGGGQQPPQNNRNNTEQSTTETHFELLCKLFKVKKLADIQIAGVFLFREITSGLPTDKARKNALKKLIQALRDDGIVKRVIKTVKNIFERLDPSEVTFQNFMNLCEMVATYVSDKLARRHEMQASGDPRPRFPLHQRRAENLAAVLRDILAPGPQNILNIFLSLHRQISAILGSMSPTFSSVFAAVYHYFKHKFVPFRFDVLTIQEYFQLITSLMPRVMRSGQYRELQNGTRRRLVYDIYLDRFGRRVRIVIQVQNGIIVISSCHILDILIDGDCEGTEEFDRN